MEITEIIETLKTHYNRDLRKQVVKTILKNEKETDRPDYQVIDQIFLYIQKELNWEFTVDTKESELTPLEVMKTVFPHIESSKWYQLQLTAAKKILDEMRKNQTDSHS